MDEREKIQNDLDNLLIFMNDDLEQSGLTIKTGYFDFTQNSQNTLDVMGQNDWTYDNLKKIVNIAIARNLIILKAIGSQFMPLALTEEGQARAISSAHGLKRSYELGSETAIGTVNIQGSAQIGSGNILSFGAFINGVEQRIGQSESSLIEQADAKRLWNQVLKNPLLYKILTEV